MLSRPRATTNVKPMTMAKEISKCMLISSILHITTLTFADRSSFTLLVPGYRAVPGSCPEVTDATDGTTSRRRPLRWACVLSGEASNRGPIEILTTLRQQPQKSIAQKTAEWQGDA
jgi:hypothetical protein